MRISALKYFRYHIGDLIFKKWSKKAFKQGAKFVQTWQVYYSNWLSPCYCVFFFINLEHLLHPTLLLLFKLLKGERWLKVYGKPFCQNNTVMITYTYSYAPEIFLWRCSFLKNKKQNSKSSINYDAMEFKFVFFSFAILVSLDDISSCDFIKVKNFHEILRYFF